MKIIQDKIMMIKKKQDKQIVFISYPIKKIEITRSARMNKINLQKVFLPDYLIIFDNDSYKKIIFLFIFYYYILILKPKIVQSKTFLDSIKYIIQKYIKK